MKKIKILVTAPLKHIIGQKKILEKNFKCTFLNHNQHKKIDHLLKFNNGWICSPSPKKLISFFNYPNVKNLKFIATPSTGTTHISEKIKKNLNIKILSLSMTKKINLIKASSEYTFSLALTLIKKILSAQKYVKKGHWRDVENILRSDELFQKSVGIIGFGRIGKNLLKYSKAFGMEPTIYDPNVRKDNYNNIKNLEKIKSKCHIIFVCINYTKKNIEFINRDFFMNLKQNPYFINTSRGEIVNEQALLMAIKKKIIKGAAIDVLQKEQSLNLSKNKLVNFAKSNENLIITPHIAGLTFQSESKAIDLVIELIKKHIKSK